MYHTARQVSSIKKNISKYVKFVFKYQKFYCYYYWSFIRCNKITIIGAIYVSQFVLLNCCKHLDEAVVCYNGSCGEQMCSDISFSFQTRVYDQNYGDTLKINAVPKGPAQIPIMEMQNLTAIKPPAVPGRRLNSRPNKFCGFQ